MSTSNISDINNFRKITINEESKKNNNELTILKQNISITEDENSQEII